MNTTPNTVEDYQGPLPDGWTGGQSVTKWWRNKYMHLYTLRRACAQCGAEMRIDVSKAALIGTAKNTGLHLKRCKACRANAQALGTSSRPKVTGDAPPKALKAFTEVEQTTIATMKDELEGLYVQNRELRDRLAKYEPEPRMPWE